MAWTAQPSLLSPANGGTLVYPSDAFRLALDAGRGRERVLRQASRPTRRSARSCGRAARSRRRRRASRSRRRSRPGTYYWSITPLDAEGHAGTPAPTASFDWTWPSTTTPSFTDLAPAPEIVDPSFSWTRRARRGGLRGRGQLLLRLGARLEGLLLAASHRDQRDDARAVALAARAARQQHLLLARPRARRQRTTPVSGTSARRSRRPSRTCLRRRRRASRTSACATTSPTRTTATIPRRSAYPLTTGTPIAHLEPRARRRRRYQVDVTPVRGRRVQLDAPNSEHWVETTASTTLDAARLGLEQREAVPEPRAGRERHRGDWSPAIVLRARPALGPRRRRRPGRPRSATGRTSPQNNTPPSRGRILRRRARAPRARSATSRLPRAADAA